MSNIEKNNSAKPCEVNKIQAVQANDLLRSTEFGLTQMELKLVFALIAQIDSVNDEQISSVRLNVSQLCHIIGLNPRSGREREHVARAIEGLHYKSFCIFRPTFASNVLYRQMRFLDYFDVLENNEGYVLQLSQALMPYVIGIKERFTKLNLLEMSQLASTYSIKLYNYCQSYLFAKTVTLTVQELAEMLEYVRGPKKKKVVWGDFKKDVLDRAVAEVNAKTTMNIVYETINEKGSRKIASVKFLLKQKKAKKKNTKSAQSMMSELMGGIIDVRDESLESQMTAREIYNSKPKTKKEQERYEDFKKKLADKVASKILEYTDVTTEEQMAIAEKKIEKLLGLTAKDGEAGE